MNPLDWRHQGAVAAVIGLGVPYTDPQADGATIQHTNQVAIKGGTSEINQCLGMVKEAREMGLDSLFRSSSWDISIPFSSTESISCARRRKFRVRMDILSWICLRERAWD
jgi:hypothetical protein